MAPIDPSRNAAPSDGVSAYPASAHDMALYEQAGLALERFGAPILIHENDPHERLYIAALDGTGNDRLKDPLHATNVARLADQVDHLSSTGDNRIAAGYVPGPGTQDSLISRVFDGAIGYTHEARVEKMYQLFIRQAAEWRRQDPEATIRVAGVGFSRGAEETASFSRLVDERGIQDVTGAVYTRDAHGNITHVQYTKPPLVPPGRVAQVVGLFDPVGTGMPVNDYDRRLPPSVISGLQIFARDEHRGLFKSDHIIDPGASPDGRFLGVRVPGAHSDVGGGYLRNGLSLRSGNLMVDYLNALSDRPFLARSPEPADPRLNVVHRSTDGLYRLWRRVDRLEPDGYNTLEAPRHHHHGYRVAGDPYNALPRDEALARQFDYQPVATGPAPSAAGETARGPAGAPSAHAVDALVERLYRASLAQDDRAMDAVAGDYLQSPEGAAWWRGIQQYGQATQMACPALAGQGQAAELAAVGGMQR